MQVLNANAKRLYGLERPQKGLIFRGHLVAVSHLGWTLVASNSGEFEEVTFPWDPDFVDVVEYKNRFRVIWPVDYRRFYEFSNCRVTTYEDVYHATPDGGMAVGHLKFVFEYYRERQCPG